MLKLIVKWLVAALSIALIAYLFTAITITDYPTALLAAFIMGIFSITLKPILKLLTLPINILTLGLFGFVVNAFILWLIAEIVPGFEIETPMAAFLGALVVLLVTRSAKEIIKDYGKKD